MEATQNQVERCCDIVMKGGITSGVVYPPVVVKLAEYLNFKNIGGTSAGAIAAAATAAAQYRKNTTGAADAFARLAALPQQLGAEVSGQTRLLSLFQPQPETRAIYRVLLAAVARGGWLPLRVAFALIRQFPFAALLGVLLWLVLGLLPVAVLAWGALSVTAGTLWYGVLAALLLAGLGLLLALASAVLLALAGPVALLVRRTLKALPKNFFGLCTGFVPEADSEADMDKSKPPLTVWLADLIDELAGLAPGGAPLTFGQLWGGDDPAAPRAINLEMMTTSLTHGLPFRLPFEPRFQRTFFFHPQEFRRLFPARVVQWMEDCAQAEEAQLPAAERGKYAPLCRLPRPAQLPVIVATRMSLSFPVLLSAVPLYAIDFTRLDPKDRVPEPVWFSDGGICSNFPVHFFDSTLPRHPTFGVNLRNLDPDRTDQRVWMPRKNVSGILGPWTRFADPGKGQPLFGFFGALLNAIQNWSDNAQTILPGYRDRIVHIFLDEEKEGGLNLDMPPELIAALGQYGAEAARELLKRYPGVGLTQADQSGADPLKTTWENHRWVRYRSLLSQLEVLLSEWLIVVENPLAGDARYEALIQNAPSYAYNPQQQARALQTHQQLLDLARDWLAQVESLREGAPNPAPELRVRPRL